MDSYAAVQLIVRQASKSSRDHTHVVAEPDQMARNVRTRLPGSAAYWRVFTVENQYAHGCGLTHVPFRRPRGGAQSAKGDAQSGCLDLGTKTCTLAEASEATGL